MKGKVHTEDAILHVVQVITVIWARRTLRFQLIKRLLGVMAIILSGISIIYMYESASKYKNYLYNENKYLTEMVMLHTQLERRKLEDFLEKISVYIGESEASPEKDLDTFKSKLSDFFKIAITGSPGVQLAYYDAAQLLKFYLGKLSFPDKFLASDFEMNNILEHNDTNEKWVCDEVCYLSISGSAFPFNPSQSPGYISLRYPLDSIMWNIKELNGIDIAVLGKNKNYAFSKSVKINDHDFFINNQTNHSLFLKLDEIKNRDKDNYEIISLSDDTYALVSFINFSDELSILAARDVSSAIHTRSKEFNRLLIISIFIISFMLVFIFYSLKKPLENIKLINETLPMIGNGNFTSAIDKLSTLSKNEVSEEILKMKHGLSLAAGKIDVLHKNYNKSILEISVQLGFIQELINSSGAIFVITNANFDILICNKYAADLLKIKHDLLLNKKFSLMFGIEENVLFSKNSELPVGSELFQSEIQCVSEKKLISWTQNSYYFDRAKELFYIYVGVDISERLRLEENIRYTASHDDLTGLSNRRKLNQVLMESVEQNKNLHFLYVDLNYFKVINDTLGHAAGDQVLISFAKLLKRTVGDKGIPARTGGDEFAIILYCNEAETIAVCNQLIESCKKIDMCRGDQDYLPSKVGLSIGIVAFPEQARDVEELYAHADAAMYENKIERSSSWHIYTGREVLIHKNRTTKYWSDLLEDGLLSHKILPHFQSIHQSDSSLHPVFYEALCRIRHNDSIIVADQFIDVLANKPIMAKVDMFMLRSVLTLSKTYSRHLNLMINISPYTMVLPNAPDHILSILKETGVSPDQVVFEITEQAAVKEFDKVIAFMNTLHAHGVRFALDDFGTGYSSLSYLELLPIQFLKLDKAFIARVDKAGSNIPLMFNIVQLVRSMGIKVIVEGVEDMSQVAWAQKSGAEYMQGYFFSKPQAELAEEEPSGRHP